MSAQSAWKRISNLYNDIGMLNSDMVCAVHSQGAGSLEFKSGKGGAMARSLRIGYPGALPIRTFQLVR
jgi:hypothetical protein